MLVACLRAIWSSPSLKVAGYLNSDLLLKNPAAVFSSVYWSYCLGPLTIAATMEAGGTWPLWLRSSAAVSSAHVQLFLVLAYPAMDRYPTSAACAAGEVPIQPCGPRPISRAFSVMPIAPRERMLSYLMLAARRGWQPETFWIRESESQRGNIFQTCGNCGC